MFNGELLRILRFYHDLNQRELGERVAVTAASISMYETGQREPEDEVRQALSDVLGVEPAFLEARWDDLDEGRFNFRSLRATPQRARNRHRSHVKLVAMWVRHIRRAVQLPPFNVPDIPVRSPEDIEAAALACREHWGLGLGPIRRWTRVLENAGIIVTRIDDHNRQVDAFSSFGDDPRIVVLSTAKGSTSRDMFDGMHELGHGVMHRDRTRKDGGAKESEANYFSGAFLLPRESFSREFRLARVSSMGPLVELKMRWGVSITAMIYRAHQLDLIDTAAYRRWMKNISRRGWRSGVQEPAEPPLEEPELLPHATRSYLEFTEQTFEQAARERGWKPDMLAEISGMNPPPSEAPATTVMSLEDYRAGRASG